MNERTTLEIIAPTVEQALAQGLAQLGLPATAVSVEVLDSGSSGLFGLGSRQVRVRLTVNPPEGTPAPVEKPAAVASPASKERPKRERPRPEQKAKPEKPKPERTEPIKREPAPLRATEILPDGHDEILDKTESVVSKLLY